MQEKFDVLLNSYLDTSVGMDTNFITEALSKGLQQNIAELQRSEQMFAAGIGNADKKDNKQTMRSDQIYWLDKSHNNTFENEFLNQIEDFIGYMNETCYTGITDYEFHYAVYETGSYYHRHKDQFQNDDNRKFSLINYLNPNWINDDGGQLLLYQNNAIQSIAPKSQTAVFFKSNETEHEVAVANKKRMSITGWLKVV